MGDRDAIVGYLYMALKVLVDLKDGERDEAYREVKEDAWQRARIVLHAFETHDLKYIEDCSPASRARAGDTSVRRTAYGQRTTDNGKRTGLSSEEKNPSTPYENTYEDAIKELYLSWIEVLTELEGGIHPSPQRVRKEPGERTKKILAKALKESSLDECKYAIRGAYIHWGRAGQGGKVLAEVFSTFRNTGPLASRIAFFASLAGYGSEQNRGLDDPGVRDRLHDVRREIRAALDMPDNAAAQRLAADGELWLGEHGLQVAVDAERRGFSLVGGPCRFFFAERLVP